MRDPDRLYKILNELMLIWSEHPDLRLGQLLLNVDYESPLYYTEDNDLIKQLKAFYNI